MFLPHMLFELVRATVTISFIVAATQDLTVMADTVVDVEDVTIEVSDTSEGLEATIVNARYSLQ